ncbi:MAG: hypothetical protein ACK5LJ_10005, partial [Paracoccus sp. (in: a-proteobacteria)]
RYRSGDDHQRRRAGILPLFDQLLRNMLILVVSKHNCRTRPIPAVWSRSSLCPLRAFIADVLPKQFRFLKAADKFRTDCRSEFMGSTNYSRYFMLFPPHQIGVTKQLKNRKDARLGRDFENLRCIDREF